MFPTHNMIDLLYVLYLTQTHKLGYLLTALLSSSFKIQVHEYIEL